MGVELDLKQVEAFNAEVYAGMDWERARKGPPEGFPKFPLIPAGRYTDPDFLAIEKKALWQNTWLYAAHEDEFPDVGSFMLWNKTGSPLLLVRGKDKKVRAFYNACRHRGAPLVQTEEGKLDGGVACKYHGWTYNLAGDLVNLRDKRDFVDLDMSCHGLKTVRCENLGNWIFINENPDAEPLLDYLGPLVNQFLQFKPHELRLVHKKSYDLKCNVKVLLDAFFETYHLQSIHQGTVDRFLDHRGTYIKLWKNGHSMMCTPMKRDDWQDPGTKGLPHIDTASKLPREENLSFHIFPNWVSPPHSTGIPVLLFWPVDDNNMRIECHWFSPPWKDELPAVWEKRIRNFENILFEDTQFCEDVQKSVESPGFTGMTLNYQERRIYHFHEELDRRMQGQGVDPALTVPPVLGDFVE